MALSLDVTLFERIGMIAFTAALPERAAERLSLIRKCEFFDHEAQQFHALMDGSTGTANH